MPAIKVASAVSLISFRLLAAKAATVAASSALETIVMITALGAGVINPAIPAAQAAVAATGRGIDALTGRRSRVRQYIEQNAGRQGIQQQQAPSLRQQAQEADVADAQRLADEAVSGVT